MSLFNESSHFHGTRIVIFHFFLEVEQRLCLDLSYDVASGSEITPCN